MGRVADASVLSFTHLLGALAPAYGKAPALPPAPTASVSSTSALALTMWTPRPARPTPVAGLMASPN